MEKASDTVKIQDGAVAVHTKPYEIKTLKITFSSKN
jgi:hypothetical protein